MRIANIHIELLRLPVPACLSFESFRRDLKNIFGSKLHECPSALVHFATADAQRMLCSSLRELHIQALAVQYCRRTRRGNRRPRRLSRCETPTGLLDDV